MVQRFPNITEKYGGSATFLGKLEKLNARIDVCTREEFLDRFREADLGDKSEGAARESGVEQELGFDIGNRDQPKPGVENIRDGEEPER